jgi:hypothetical protein
MIYSSFLGVVHSYLERTLGKIEMSSPEKVIYSYRAIVDNFPASGSP